MQSKIAKHPIHPMVVPFPIALWIFSLIADVMHAAGWGGPAWNDAAFYTMAVGTIGALVAAPFGLIDLLSLSDPHTKVIGKAHMLLNLFLVVLFAVNLWLRIQGVPVAGWPIALSVLGLLCLGISGWLGGELVYVRGVAVETKTDTKAKTPRDMRMAG